MLSDMISMAPLTSRSYPVRLRMNTRRYKTLGTLNQPRLVTFHRSAANYPSIVAQILEKTDSLQIQTIITTVASAAETAASVAETARLARSLVENYLPYEVRHYISYEFHRSVRPRIVSYFSSKMTIVIEEFEGIDHNKVFEAAEAYLATKISPSNKKLKVSKHDEETNYNVTVERDEEVVDTFNGVKFRWILHCHNVESKNSRNSSSEKARSFHLNFNKKFKDMALDSYLPFMVKSATLMKQEKKKLNLFTLDPDKMYWDYSDAWTSVTLDHPSTFKTLAMDPDFKKSVVDDLDQFVQRRDFYKSVGKAWKRGYLLYGPPGTGKSSLIAAMANHLNFDIYDLELTAVESNSQLRRLLLATANRSILVVEDIDCSIEWKDRTSDGESKKYSPYKKVTLSGLLNFIDGLWSSCGDERIIVFTTNYKEKLDAALLRPGRMDMHIHMSYCTPAAFKVLASNYLKIEEHELFDEIEEGIKATEVTPADVAEQLMRNGSVDHILEGLIEFLRVKKIKNEQEKAEKEKKELEKMEKDIAKQEKKELEKMEKESEVEKTKKKGKDSEAKKKRKG